MTSRRLALAMVIVSTAIGCSTKTLKVAPSGSLKSVSSHVVVNVAGPTVAPEVLADLTRFLKAGLIVAGFEIENPPPDALRLDVQLHEFDPGNAALRLTVGFGAGRGSLLYTARFLDADQEILAELEGQERFTGSEPHFNAKYGQLTTLMGAERVQSALVQEAAEHIVQLALGELRPKKSSGTSNRR